MLGTKTNPSSSQAKESDRNLLPYTGRYVPSLTFNSNGLSSGVKSKVGIPVTICAFGLSLGPHYVCRFKTYVAAGGGRKQCLHSAVQWRTYASCFMCSLYRGRRVLKFLRETQHSVLNCACGCFIC